MQMTYLLNNPMVNLLFYCHILTESVLLKRNLVKILTLKSKMFGKFQTFNTIDARIKMAKKSRISKNFN